MNIYKIYKKEYKKIFYSLLSFMLVIYIAKINNGAGGDLMLRISESKYFIARINPYDVYTGTHQKITALGWPNAYSFVSYYLMLPFTLIESEFVQKVLFSLLDITLLAVGIKMVNQLLGKEKFLSAPIVVSMLLVSVFFWQQINTLNYNIVAAFGIILIFYSISQGSILSSALGLVLIGVKPSFALPVIIYLVATCRWKILIIGGFFYFLMLGFAAYWINTSPFEILIQLKNTQSKFSNGHTDGILFFAKEFLQPNISLLFFGILISVAVIYFFKKEIKSPINGLIATITLGVSLFYNHVHAWIIVYPILICAISDIYKNKNNLAPAAYISIFLLTPRFAGLFDEQIVDTYVAFHNIIRFGLLYISSAILIKNNFQITQESNKP